MVTLSGFVPQPMMPSALAETATISASGTFSDGITMTAGGNLQFKIIVATKTNGEVTVHPSGATSVKRGFFVSAPQAGTIQFNAASIKAVDIIIQSGLQKSILLTGVSATNQITIDKIALSGPFAKQVFKIGKSTQTGVPLTNKTTNINVGAQVSWGGGPLPIGKFTQSIKISISF